MCKNARPGILRIECASVRNSKFEVENAPDVETAIEKSLSQRDQMGPEAYPLATPWMVIVRGCELSSIRVAALAPGLGLPTNNGRVRSMESNRKLES